MVSRLNGRRPWLVACVTAVSLAVVAPAFGQSTGMIKGVVKDASGQPVEGAKVTIDMVEGVSRHFGTKSNKKGEVIQIGLQGGPYKGTGEKDKLTSNTADVRVTISRPAEVNLVLGAGGASAAATKEAAAKNAELKKTFEEGVAASRA